MRGAPSNKLLAVSRPALLLAGMNAAIAFSLGASRVADSGPKPLGVPYERFLLIHLSIALIGWLTILIAAVGRTLVPMLGPAAAAKSRKLPLAEVTIAAGLWLYVLGLASESDTAVAAGIVVMVLGLAPVAGIFRTRCLESAQVARGGGVLLVLASATATIGVTESLRRVAFPEERLRRLDEAAAARLGDGLELRVAAELSENRLDMVADRDLGDAELAGDDLRRKTAGEELEHLALAPGQGNAPGVAVLGQDVAVVQHVQDDGLGALELHRHRYRGDELSALLRLDKESATRDGPALAGEPSA